MRKVRIALMICFMLIIASGCSAPKRTDRLLADRPVRLIVATDLHYISSQLTDNGEYFLRLVENADGKYMMFSEEIMDAFVDEVISEQPDALILTGDLTFNGAMLSHEHLSKKLSKIEKAGIPVYVLPGNHDLNSKIAASFHGSSYSLVSGVDAKEFEKIYHDFGYDQALYKDADSLSYVAEITSDLWLLVIDANGGKSSNQLSDETLQWIEKQLQVADEKKVHVISASHQNLLQHNSLFYSGFVIKNHDQLEDLYREYGVLLNLSGHMHMQHTKTDSGLSEIATSSLMISPNQYGMITVTTEGIEYLTRSVDVSSWAEKNQLSGYENFKEGSHAFFWETSYRQIRNSFSNDPDQQAIAEFVADLNCAYFSGTMNEIEWKQDLFDKIQEYQIPFTYYIQSIRGEEKTNHQQFHLEWE